MNLKSRLKSSTSIAINQDLSHLFLAVDAAHVLFSMLMLLLLLVGVVVVGCWSLFVVCCLLFPVCCLLLWLLVVGC